MATKCRTQFPNVIMETETNKGRRYFQASEIYILNKFPVRKCVLLRTIFQNCILIRSTDYKHAPLSLNQKRERERERKKETVYLLMPKIQKI